jgi:hypothetical protein
VSFDMLSSNFGVIEGVMSRYSGKLTVVIVRVVQVGNTVLFVRMYFRWLISNFTCTSDCQWSGPRSSGWEPVPLHLFLLIPFLPNASTVKIRTAVDPLRCSLGWRTGGLFQYRVSCSTCRHVVNYSS